MPGKSSLLLCIPHGNLVANAVPAAVLCGGEQPHPMWPWSLGLCWGETVTAAQTMLAAPARQGALPAAGGVGAGQAGNGAPRAVQRPVSGLSIMQGKKCRKGVRKDNRKWATWLGRKKHPAPELQLASEGSQGGTETAEPCYTLVW